LLGGVGARIANMNPLVWVGIALAAALGYGAKLIMKRLPFRDEAARERAALISKGVAVVIAMLSLLLATGNLG
jgi:hypothetical protein